MVLTASSDAHPPCSYSMNYWTLIRYQMLYSFVDSWNFLKIGSFFQNFPSCCVGETLRAKFLKWSLGELTLEFINSFSRRLYDKLTMLKLCSSKICSNINSATILFFSYTNENYVIVFIHKRKINFHLGILNFEKYKKNLFIMENHCWPDHELGAAFF